MTTKSSTAKDVAKGDAKGSAKDVAIQGFEKALAYLSGGGGKAISVGCFGTAIRISGRDDLIDIIRLGLAMERPKFTARRADLRKLLTDRRRHIDAAMGALAKAFEAAGCAERSTFSGIRDHVSVNVLIWMVAESIPPLDELLRHCGVGSVIEAIRRNPGSASSINADRPVTIVGAACNAVCEAVLRMAREDGATPVGVDNPNHSELEDSMPASVESAESAESVILPSAGGRASQLGQFSQAVVAAIGALERGVELANVMDAVSRNFGPGVAAAVHAYIKARDVEKDIAAGAKPSVNVEELGGVKAGPAAAITIDESYLPGLEKLFETATGGAGGGIRALLDAANKHHAVVDGLRRDVIKTQSRLQDAEMQVKELSDKLDEKAKAVQELERKLVVKEGEGKRVVWDIKGNAGEAAGGEAVPDGRMSMRPAKEVFGIEDGRLAFDIPVWEWDGANPYVPEKDVDYAFDAEHVATLAFAVNRGRNLWVKGPTGSGKTSLIEQYCAWTGTMNMRVNLDSELSRMDLVGRDILKADGKGGTLSEFVEGILPKAMKLPCILTCDEMDAVRPDIAYVFQRVLEGKGLLLAEDGGRVIVPHPEFRLFATANTVGQGDEDGMYPAVRPQSQAMLDRFAFWMDVPYMEAEREVGLLMKRVPGLGKDEAERMVKFAGEVRRAFENGDCMQTISLRALVAMGEKFLATGDLSMAAMTTVLNKASKHDRATIKGLADASLLGGAVSL